MKKSLIWLAIALAPALLISPVSAEEKASPAAEKSAEAKIPSLTFYYYDG